MGLLTTLGAAAAGLLAGGLWFDALARPWARARGLPALAFRGGLSDGPAVLTVIAALLSALLMRHGFTAAGIMDPYQGALCGAALGAAAFAPWTLSARRGGRLAPWWADAGAAVAALAAVGALLGV